jgi:class III poly(R)-hydroxyalkanoic acid synthase PhaE subunit
MFLAAWNDYIQATQKVLERLADPARSTPPPSLPFMDAWLNFAKGLGMQSGSEAFGAKMADALATFAPKVGNMREYQEIAHRMLEHALKFQRLHREWLDLGNEVTESALRAVRERASSDPTVSASPESAYEAWIESAEAAYAQAAHSDEFGRTLGELCNLMSAFKVERGKLLEAVARHFDLPSRAEVDSLHRQISELRRTVHTPASAKAPGQKARRRPRRSKPS